MRFILWSLMFFLLTLAACSNNTTSSTEAQVLSHIWQALEPNTTSHNQANWEVVESRSVSGHEVSDLFNKQFGYCPGPTPVPNQNIDPNATYWYVHMRPLPATPLPGPTLSPTAPPNIPEPFFEQAHFLVDPTTNKIVARLLGCVIY